VLAAAEEMVVAIVALFDEPRIDDDPVRLDAFLAVDRPLGILRDVKPRPVRCSGFSAVRNSAPFGIQRSQEFSALRNSALLGIQRRDL
jgi:hypothetical protein